MKNVFLNKELHLAIVWKGGRHKEHEIVKFISNQFELLEQYKINWNKASFNKSLSLVWNELYNYISKNR